MSNVIPLSTRDMQVWVCKCGCYSFELREDGKAVCNACHAEPNNNDGLGWWRPKQDDDKQVDKNMRPVSSTLSNVENYSRYRMEHEIVADQTVSWVAYGRDDGSVQTWKKHPQEDGSPDRNRWILRRLKDAARLLLDQNLLQRKDRK